MFDVKIERPVCCPELAQGMDIIAQVAEKAYGGGSILCADATGASVCSANMKEVLMNGRFEDPNAEYARRLITQQELPGDGLKTAILLANACLKTARDSGMDRQDFLAGVEFFLKTAAEKLREIVKANSEDLPGGGLYLLNLCRPMMRAFEKGVTHPACQKFIYALEKPFLILAQNAGCEPHGAFACIKAVAPTQFYSLKQFGLESGHIPMTEHRDLWRMGIDVQTGKVMDVMEAHITVPMETALSVLKTAQAILFDVCAVCCVL
ncbi:MAG: hypothetical protein ACOYJC_06470 [Christensenellales bacterium]|jgi:chaperonin GroEL (HSP60 family)